MEFICESILDMLHSGPCFETRFMAAKCLSHLAIALEVDAKRLGFCIPWNARGIVINDCGLLQILRLDFHEILRRTQCGSSWLADESCVSCKIRF